jgi:hypothetical protein
MHFHGNSMNLNTASFYAVSQSEKAEAARRATNVRKKLLKGAAEIEGSATPEETLLIDQWTASQPGQAQGQKPSYTGSSGRDSDFG